MVEITKNADWCSSNILTPDSAVNVFLFETSPLLILVVCLCRKADVVLCLLQVSRQAWCSLLKTSVTQRYRAVCKFKHKNRLKKCSACSGLDTEIGLSTLRSCTGLLCKKSPTHVYSRIIQIQGKRKVSNCKPLFSNVQKPCQNT